MVHYVIIIVIIYCQILFYIKNIRKQKELESIFPEDEDCDAALTVFKNEEDITIASYKSDSEILTTIIKTINAYLAENKGAASDFHLVKDVVERNCEAVEEEISTLTPIPLYLGLIGTMAGILVGVSFLVFTGGLENLLNTTTEEVSGAGIIGLLEGVALAMITSIAGILLTTAASYSTKNAKNTLNRNKNAFLSWIQVKLLPVLTNNTTSVIYTMQQNLSNFNATFGKNVDAMEGAFTTMSSSYQSQVELIQLLDKMDVSQIAKANVMVLRELQSSTREFEKFNQYLHQVGNYLEQVENLNCGLNEHLNRTKVIEDMGVFFKDEIQQIEQRKGAISQTVGAIDVTMQNAIGKLKDSNAEQINGFIQFSVAQQEKLTKVAEQQEEEFSTFICENQNDFKNAIDAQQELMRSKLLEANMLIEELKNLSSIKTSMSGVEDAMLKQANRISELITGVERLAVNRVGGNPVVGKYDDWLKLGGIVIFIIVGLSGLIYIVSQILDYVNRWIG